MTIAPQPAHPLPRILVFYCTHCQGPEATPGSIAVGASEASITTVHFTCARDVHPEDIRRGFAAGADGVLICGCLVRNCPGSGDDLAVLRDIYRNQVVLKAMGLETDRLREEWILEGTTDDLETIIGDFARQLRLLGPVDLPAETPLRAEEGRA